MLVRSRYGKLFLYSYCDDDSHSCSSGSVEKQSTLLIDFRRLTHERKHTGGTSSPSCDAASYRDPLVHVLCRVAEPSAVLWTSIKHTAVYGTILKREAVPGFVSESWPVWRPALLVEHSSTRRGIGTLASLTHPLVAASPRSLSVRYANVSRGRESAAVRACAAWLRTYCSRPVFEGSSQVTHGAPAGPSRTPDSGPVFPRWRSPPRLAYHSTPDKISRNPTHSGGARTR